VGKSAAWLALSAAFCLTGCVSVFEGTSQEITVVTNPAGAHCAFQRNDGKDMGNISATPGTLSVRKSKFDLTITCNKDGYQQATYLNHSGLSSVAAANIAADLILTAGISSIVDSANGADNHYDPVVNISLTPVLPVIQAAAAPVMQTLAPVSDTNAEKPAN
jgi:hypothetical protein